MRFLRRFLRRDATFLEIGPGDCALTFRAAGSCRMVYAVEVSEEITRNLAFPRNVRLLLSDGTSIPVPDASVAVAYSNQLMEHLHPDDAVEQLRNIWKALAPGGVYVCITPNRINGPHDVSRHFDAVAQGFHLKEYSVEELDDLFRMVGFSRTRVYVGAKGWFIGLPTRPVKLCERVLDRLPDRWRRAIALSLPMKAVLGVRMAATKP
jgi:SAM-dependent methyltransferase